MKDFLFVFDLDFTIWNCGGTWCDHSLHPYRKKNGRVYDSNDQEMILYPDIMHILEELFHAGTNLAVASRTGEPIWAEDLMKMFGIFPYFKFKEIYPGSKINHFMALHEYSDIPFDRMIFFDDEPRNIHEVSSLGVNCVQVYDGLSYERYKASLRTISSSEFV